MAEQNINTNITATANFSSLTSQLQSVTAQLIKLQTTTIGLNKDLAGQIGRMNRSFVDTMRSTGQFSSHFVTLNSDVEKFGKNLDSGRMKLSQYYNTWQGHARKTSTLVKDLAKQQVMLENAIIQPLGKNAQGLMQYNVLVGQGLDATTNKLALARQEAAIMNKVMQQGANQLINWGKNTQWAGRQLTVGLTVPLAAFGVAASKAFQQADQELVRLTKVYGGLTATSSEELLKVRKDVAATAKALASQYGAAYTETIGLAADIAATGKQGNDLIQATQQTTRLAVLGEVDRQDAMKATLAIQNAFKQNTVELTQSIDFLNAVENQTSTSLSDLVEAIPKAGPVIQAMGGSVKDLALYMTAMKEGGIDASSGANALKSALASLVNPTKVAIGMFQGFGIDLGGIVTRNAGNLTATILELQGALDKLDPLKKQQAIEQLFGKFQFARMNALFANLGKQGSQTLAVLDLMKASSAELAGISSRELSQMTESASGKYKRALESVKADLAGVGESFLKINTAVLKTIDGIVKFVNNLPGPIKSILTFVGGLTALAGPLIMLTGVLGNFFGYIIKGIFHLKNLFKGGQGFKLLTPEIMAADAAAKTIAETFYSDAKAAEIFADAVYTLSASFDKLKASALNAATVTNSVVTTMQGTPILGQSNQGLNAARQANKDHPLVGKPYSRQMAHLIPAATEQPGTIFGTVPNPGPVNVRLGKNPQVYMNGEMPKIPGVTSVNGVSTGIVATEAAKWHSMTAALATQSEAELAALKVEVAATGTITAELSSAYSAMLPQMTQITALAADEAALIVKELEVGKITVDQARAKIISLNATIETMMAETSAQVASGMGRNINLSTVPLTSQPVTGAGGKSNMKELFHKGPTANLVDTIAKNLGVRTSGGGYSIETTRPIKRNTGGPVYLSEGSQSVVPGVGNTDTVPAMLTPGEFVVNKKATQENFPLLQAINNKYAVGGVVQEKRVGYGPRPVGTRDRNMTILLEALGLRAMGPRSAASLNNISKLNEQEQKLALSLIQEKIVPNLRRIHPTSSDAIKKDGIQARTTGVIEEKHIRDVINPLLKENNIPALPLREELHATHMTQRDGALVSRFTALFSRASNLEANNARLRPIDFINKDLVNHGALNKYQRILKSLGITGDKAKEVELAIDARLKSFFENEAKSRNVDISSLPTIGDTLYPKGAQSGNKVAGAGYTFENDILPQLELGMSDVLGDSFKSHPQYQALKKNELARRIQKLAVGGMVQDGKHAYGFKSASPLAAARLAEITARWPKPRQFYQPGFQYMLGNQDPLHGPLQIGMSQNLNRYAHSKDNPYFRESVVYKDDRFNRINIMDAFLTGTMEKRGKYATAQYMEGNLNLMAQMEKLGNHPLGPIAAMRSIQKKFSGKLFRGLNLEKTYNALPSKLTEAIKLARATGDASSLLGQEFIMRRSSWSKDKNIASFFAPGHGVKENNLLIEAAVRNRNILPAGDMFPDKKFMAPYGQDWSGGKLGQQSKSEKEAIFGGKFRVVGFDKGVLKVESVADGKQVPGRALGGSVSAGTTYVVGENGPELFRPMNSGGIVPTHKIQHLIKGGKAKFSNWQMTGSQRNDFPVLPPNAFGPLLDSIDTGLLQLTSGIKSATLPIANSFKTISAVVKNSSRQSEIGIKLAESQIGDSIKSFTNKIASAGQNASQRIGSAIKSSIPGQEFTKAKQQYYSTNSSYWRSPFKKKGGEGMNLGAGSQGSFAASMALGSAGTMIGGTAGMALQIGSMVAMMGGLEKVVDTVKKLRTAWIAVTAAEGAATVAARVFATASTAAMMSGPQVILLAIIASVVALTMAFKAVQENSKNLARQNSLTTGMTEKAAKQAGLQYHNLSDRIKEVTASFELARAKGLAAFDRTQWAGIQGITLTIKELRDGIKAAKKDQTELVDTFSKVGVQKFAPDASNKSKQEDINKIAANLKAQFMAAGDSAEVATNKVYVLIKASKNSDKAFSAITTSPFKGIIDSATAADYMIKQVNDSMSQFTVDANYTLKNTLEGADLGNALSNTTDILSKNMNKLIGTKDAQGQLIDAAKAYEITMKKINAVQGSNKTLTQSQVDSLKETHPQLQKILNTSDTTASVFAKWQLLLSGVAVDLKNITAVEAQALMQYEAMVNSQISAMEKAGTGIIGKSQTIIAKLQKQIGKGLTEQTKSAEATKKQIEEEIKLIDKRIKKINEEADARKKALQDQQNENDIKVQIAQAQLENQDALARGDMAAAAQAQLKIQQLVSQQQTVMGLNAIEEKRAKEVAIEDAKKEAAQLRAEKIALRIATMQENAAVVQERVSKIDMYQNEYERLVKDQGRIDQMAPGAGKDEAIKALRGSLSELAASISKDIKGKDKTLADSLMLIFKDKVVSSTGESLAGKVVAKPDPAGFHPSPGSSYVTGLADAALKSDSKAIDAAILKLGGGATLKNVVDAIIHGNDSAKYASNIKTDSKKYTLETSGKNKGYLTDDSKKQVAEDNMLQPGEYFTYAGYYYRLDKDGNVIRGKAVPKKATGGYITHYDNGGNVRGPGTGTSDSIPAYLSNGEYVVRAAAVEQYGKNFFDAANAQKLHKGGAAGHKHDNSQGNFWSRFNPINGISSMLTGMFNFGTTQTFKSTPPTNLKSTTTQQEKDYMALLVAQGLSGYTSAFNLKNNTSPDLFGHKSLGVTADILGLLPAIGAVGKLSMGAKLSLVPKTVVHAAMTESTLPKLSEAGNNTLKNFLQSTTAAKKLVNSIYSRKDLTIGEKIYPTYKLAGQKEKFAFEGYKENLSSLSDSGIRVVKTNPESLLEEAAKLSPNKKTLSVMLDNFKNNKIGKQERILLDEITAATAINNKGAVTFGHQTDGFAMILSALSGNKAAQSVINVKRAHMYEIIKASKIATKNKNIDSVPRRYPEGTEAADPSSISVFHSTKFPIVRDNLGNIILHPHGEYYDSSGVPRASIHTTLEAPVEDHVFGQWSNTNNKIISPLSSMIKNNGVPYNLNSTDTWWMRNPGQALKISNGIVIRPFTNTAAYYRELLKSGIIKNGQAAPLITFDKTGKDIFRLAKEKFTPADREEILKIAKQEEVYIREADLIGNENAVLDKIATVMAKNKLKTNPGVFKLDQWSLGSATRQAQIDMLVEKLGLRGGIHSQSGPESLETNLMKSTQSNYNMLDTYAQDSLEAIRFATKFGRFKTNIRDVKDPDAWNIFAKGGYVSTEKMSIPKFESGINMVPADMLAMIHKNEAIIPANMNPFNPNAKDAISQSSVYNVNIELNGTTVTVDDVMNKFDQKMRLLNASQGRKALVNNSGVNQW